jgi:mono/diheme cytochrome c family protein
MFKGLIMGIIVGFLLVGAAIHLYFAGGHAPVATSAPPMPFERKYAHIALDAYLDKLPHSSPQVPEDEKNFLAGAGVYKEQCAVCHGLPGQDRTAIAEGMFPKPPQLFHGMGVTDDEAWETYWKVENGIRMTGMPGFKGQLNETQIWQVSVLVKNADKLPASVKTELLPTTPPVGVLPVAPSPVVPPQKSLVQP